jgi:hypothetical protein
MIRIGTTTELNFQQAKEKYLELKENQTNPQEHSPQKEKPLITFQEFYDTYYLPYIQTHIKSYETNISIFKNHILSDLKDIPMLNLKKIDVMSLHSNMLHKKNLAPATANKLLIFLNSAYNLANTYELLDDYNPCRGVKEYELNNQRQLFLSKAQAKRLLNEVEISPNIHLKYIIPMLLLTGADELLFFLSEFIEDIRVEKQAYGIQKAKDECRRLGRPPKLSHKEVLKAIELKQNNTSQQVANRFGVGRSTLYRHIAKYKEAS